MKYHELFTKLMKECGQSDKHIACALVGEPDREVSPEEEKQMTDFAKMLACMPKGGIENIGKQLKANEIRKN